MKIEKSQKIILSILIIVVLIIIGGLIMTDKSIRVRLETSKGDIILELYSQEAPVTVENFIRYVKEGHYENTVFHRIIKDFMIQGGGFTADGIQKPTRDPIILESKNGLKNERGTIAMARTYIPDSATSQFFINTKDNNLLNYGVRDEGYAVFGKVIEGMDVVESIEKSQTIIRYGMEDWPIEDILIIKAEII